MSQDIPEGEKKPAPPRLRVTKGTPWRIDAGRRAKWSAPEFLSSNAVEVRQIGDPVLHAPAKKPRLGRPELEALVARMFASMVVAHGIGIAAPQIGVPLRVVIMDVDLDQLLTNESVLSALQSATTADAVTSALASVPGLKVNLDPQITIEFTPR